MFFKAVQHIWKSVFSILWYWGLKSLIPDNPSLLWSSCSQAGWGILHWEKKSRSLITYCPRKVYWTILHCRLWRISRNALTRVHWIGRLFEYWQWIGGYVQDWGLGLDWMINPELALDSASMRADQVLINCTDRLVWWLGCGPWRWTDGLLKDWLWIVTLVMDWPSIDRRSVQK